MSPLHLPSSFSEIPLHRLSYAHPSPIHLLPGLTRYVNDTSDNLPMVKLWVKREDQAGPLICYGNKYRKFEYIIPDILARKNVTTIVTEGALQSNHTVQVASMARILGLKCTVLLHQGIDGLREATNKVFFAQSDTGDETGPLIPALDGLGARGEVPYWISSGASLHPLGGLGYARCAFVIMAQEEQLVEDGELRPGQRFDPIFVACGSGSTLAGLIAGFKLVEKTYGRHGGRLPRRVIGVMTSPKKSLDYQKARVLRLARMTGRLIGLSEEEDITEQDITEQDIILNDSFVGKGYGILDKDTTETVPFKFN